MQKTDTKSGFLRGAFTIAAGGFIAKLIGALYRIPLTNLIGGHGIGLYQMVYPVYCMLLTVSATGIPSSIAKLTADRVSRNESAKPVLKTAMQLFVIIGVIGSLLMVAFAPLLARAQGSKEVIGGYFALAPSVALVSAISVFRGYFQGKNRMSPTAVSEVIEQLVKVGIGIFFAYLFRKDIAKAVTYLLLAVSISEVIALLVMIIIFRRIPAPVEEENAGGRVEKKIILKMSIPLTLSSILIPLSGFIDSILAIRLMSAYARDAVSLYGLFSGGAVTVINLPVSICYGIAAASIPAVAAARAKGESVRKKIFYALGITLLISIPASVGLFVLARPVVGVIFRSLSAKETEILVKLVKNFSISAVTLSCAQTLSACLTAQGKPKYPAFSMLIGIVIKTAVYAVLLQRQEISVFGLVIATNICYLVAFLLNLLYNLRVSKQIGEKV